MVVLEVFGFLIVTLVAGLTGDFRSRAADAGGCGRAIGFASFALYLMELTMEGLSKIISAVASLAWPVVFAVVLYKLRDPIRVLVESARGRKFTIKVAGNELTMEEASEQQRAILSDLQSKIAALQRQLEPNVNVDNIVRSVSSPSKKTILWVDDNLKNNSYLVASLEERGATVDIALSTDEALAKFNKRHYDFVISDMGRPEGDKAGIDLTRKLKARSPTTSLFIFCGFWASSNLRGEALKAGVTEITSSGTTLLSALPLGSNG